MIGTCIFNIFIILPYNFYMTIIYILLYFVLLPGGHLLQHCSLSSYWFSPQSTACVVVHSWHKQKNTREKLRSILTDVQLFPQKDLSCLFADVSHARVSFRKWKTISDIWAVFISSPLLSPWCKMCSNTTEQLRSWVSQSAVSLTSDHDANSGNTAYLFFSVTGKCLPFWGSE